MKKIFPFLAIVTALLLSYGLYQALGTSPNALEKFIGPPAPSIYVPTASTAKEVELSNVFRIFYYHVPSAWVAFLLFMANFVASIVYLINRKPGVDAFALATAEVGVVFCTVVLVTGPIWARPVWGIWWTWDARLTSTLVLWLIYVSYLILRRYAAGGQTPVLAAALAIFGFVDVPLVYMSIRWFRTQHPQPVIGGDPNSGIAHSMLHALLINFAAFGMFAWLVTWLRYTMERERIEFDEAHALKAIGGAR
jgi:heme exporter protein C